MFASQGRKGPGIRKKQIDNFRGKSKNHNSYEVLMERYVKGGKSVRGNKSNLSPLEKEILEKMPFVDRSDLKQNTVFIDKDDVRFKQQNWQALSESDSKLLVPRIWNETLTENQKNSALDIIVGDSVKLSEYRKLINSKWSDLPEWLQNKLFDHYRWRTTLEYDGSDDHGWNSMTPEQRKEIVRKGANNRRQFSNIAVWNDSFTGTYDEKSPLLKYAFERGLKKQKAITV